jgi:tRNA1Val (adenine37-N6)-methyltransferase
MCSAPSTTRDTLFGGEVVLFQPERGVGYRTNVDALLLADFAAAPCRPSEAPTQKAASLAFDLGAGVGAVGLSLLRFGAARRVVFVEVDALAAEMARRNLDANGWSDRGDVALGDVCDVATARRGEAQLVVCNPPYIAPGRGRSSPVEARARVGELSRFVQAARQLAGKGARACFVYPAAELAALISAFERNGLYAKRLRFVHAAAAKPARIALVEARAGRPGGLAVLPALVERDVRGYTDELQTLLAQPPRSTP